MEVILESLDKDDPFSIFKGPGTSLMTGEGSLSSPPTNTLSIPLFYHRLLRCEQ